MYNNISLRITHAVIKRIRRLIPCMILNYYENKFNFFCFKYTTNTALLRKGNTLTMRYYCTVKHITLLKKNMCVS